MKYIKEIEYLTDAFKSFPGVGTKTAQRYSFFIANKDQKYIDELINRIQKIRENVRKCKLCNNFTNTDICYICSNQEREKKLCIVTNYEDFEKIENTNIFNGYYYVLFGEVNVKRNINFDFIDIQKMITMINTLNINEVIIATSFSTSGELTANYIFSKLNHIKTIQIYRLGFGIPLNANIDYIDSETIKQSFYNKKHIG